MNKSGGGEMSKWPFTISKYLSILAGAGLGSRERTFSSSQKIRVEDIWKGGELSHHETSIITGAIDLTGKTAKDAMTPISETFSLDINSKFDMVYESWQLYEILNQFQKVHSHMAVVLKSNKDTESTMGASTFLNIITNKISNPSQVVVESDSSFVLEISQRSSVHESSVNSSDAEFRNPTLKNLMELDGEVHQESNQWEQENEYFSQEQIESLPDVKEVIGIIIMEDVMEELFQGLSKKLVHLLSALLFVVSLAIFRIDSYVSSKHDSSSFTFGMYSRVCS
ncbi:hypothetical protein JHK86_035064 [Glycine max]|nr:hypothetical protein JHK86_035064 [Glycine max]